MYEKEINDHKESEKRYSQLFVVFAIGAVILFLLGLFTITKPLIYLSFLPLIVSLCFMKKRDNHSKSIRDIEHMQRMQKLDARLHTYNSVKDTATAAYHKVCDILQKPAQTYYIEVFSTESLQDICEEQAEGDWWKTLTRPCECWADIKSKEHNIGAFCMIETFESFNTEVARLPDFFTTDQKAFKNVWRKYIPFSDILYYTVIGDVSVTSSMSGSDATYHGVSINGIGFGEWEVDPIQIRHKEHDRRMIALIYRDCDEECSLFYPIETLPRLQALIPQYDKTK